MSDPIQLSEKLVVAWEGDVEGYAPAMELWNRVMVALEGELKGLDWARRSDPKWPLMLQKTLPGLLSSALRSVGAEVAEPSPNSRLINIALRGENIVLLCSVETKETRPGTPVSMFSMWLPQFIKLKHMGTRVAISFELVLNEDEFPVGKIPLGRSLNFDMRMTGKWNIADDAHLTVDLLWGLHTKSARVAALKLVNTGPAEELVLDPLGSRMNVITGDNGLGKSFFLETLWFMLTGHWHNFPAVVNDVDKKACLTARLREGSQTEVRQALWLAREQGWASPREHTADTEKMGFYTDRSFTDFSYLEGSPEGPAQMDPGLVVYARVDGSFSVWDSHRNVQGTVLRDGVVLPAPRVYPFSYREVMHGLKVQLDDKNEREVSLGLINEWREWQTGNKPQFALLQSILAALGPDGEPLTPGEPRRPYLDEAKDIPTIQMGYGQEVPITLAPAGVKRVAMFAYVLTWAISEHQRLLTARAGLPARSVVLLIDEPETHLHPRWQRTILPSLLKALEVGFGEPKVDVQMFVATHSPLVLASLEPHFDPALDALWKLDLVPGENGAPGTVKVERDKWRMRGDVGRWLRSDVFDMASTYSLPAERAISRAKAAMKAGERDAAVTDTITAELKAVLPELDPFLFEWSHFLTFIARGGAR